MGRKRGKYLLSYYWLLNVKWTGDWDVIYWHCRAQLTERRGLRRIHWRFNVKFFLLINFSFQYLKTLNSEDFLFLYGIGRNVDSSTLNMVLQALAEAKKSELGEKQETRFRSVGEEENIHKKGKLSLMIPKWRIQDLSFLPSELIANVSSDYHWLPCSFWC